MGVTLIHIHSKFRQTYKTPVVNYRGPAVHVSFPRFRLDYTGLRDSDTFDGLMYIGRKLRSLNLNGLRASDSIRQAQASGSGLDCSGL